VRSALSWDGVQQLQLALFPMRGSGRTARCAAQSILSVRLLCGRTIDLVWRPLAVHRSAEYLALERARRAVAG
jgi:hypothetical protein